MTYRFAICDDMSTHIQILQGKIERIMNPWKLETIIDTYSSGMSLLNRLEIHGNSYDIIFLDMEMPLMNGLETGKKIRTLDKDVIIIYITGFVHYALKAYEIRAFDYIIKPVNTLKLKKTLEDAISRIEKNRKKDFVEEVCLTISHNKKAMEIPEKDIVYLSKNQNITKIVCTYGTFDVYDSLKNIMNQLNKEIFIQSHEGFIVNKNHIRLYENQKLTLTTDVVIPVSKKNAKRVKEIFFEVLRK